MNKSQRAWICFPWHGFRLNSRALNPDIRLSFSPKPQWAEKSTKHGDTNTPRHLPFLSHDLFLCGQVVPVALLDQVKDFSLSLFVLSEWRRKRITEGKIKRVPLDTKGSVLLPGSLGERVKKLTSSEEGGGDSSIVPSLLTHCVCVCVFVCLQEWLNAEASQSIQIEESNTFQLHYDKQYTHKCARAPSQLPKSI